MAKTQELSVQEKKELTSEEEKTVPARYYVPNADIFETDSALTVVTEMPGVEKKDVSVSISRTACSASRARSTSQNTRGSNPCTPSTISATTRAHSRSPTRSIKTASLPT